MKSKNACDLMRQNRAMPFHVAVVTKLATEENMGRLVK